jgi:hypothetical protein
VSIILKKLNKKAINLKFYKVILLLNYLEKVIEKIIAARLFYIAKILDLLDID